MSAHETYAEQLARVRTMSESDEVVGRDADDMWTQVTRNNSDVRAVLARLDVLEAEQVATHGLREALRRAADEFEHDVTAGWRGESDPVLAAIRAALAKAGGQP